MSMKDVDNENSTKTNMTRSNVYIIYNNKYVNIERKRTTTSMRGKYMKIMRTCNNAVSIQERSLHCLCWIIKGQDRIGNRSVRILSALCEVACEQNSRGLKTAVVKI